MTKLIVLSVTIIRKQLFTHFGIVPLIVMFGRRRVVFLGSGLVLFLILRPFGLKLRTRCLLLTKNFVPLSFKISSLHVIHLFFKISLLVQFFLAAKTQLETFKAANWCEEGGLLQPQRKLVAAVVKKWTGPQFSYVKANWNAALHSASTSTAFGGIIRDPGGDALVKICSSISNLYSPSLAEALALRKIDGLPGPIVS